MTEIGLEIVPFEKATHLDDLLALTVRAWEPVFPEMEKAIPDYVYHNFYPNGWEARQIDDVRRMCDDPDIDLRVALSEGKLAGYMGLRKHVEDSMGEIYIVAVDPQHQKFGIGKALMEFALNWMRDRNLAMAMVETGADPGHAPSRATYESAGFERYPVARYFRKL